MNRPNIVFILPDQLRADFLGCYGAGFVDTPHMDRIAAQGVRYSRAYSASPICVPARASLLTGLNAIRNGVVDNGLWLRPDLAACGVRTWPELLAAAGYHTAAVGKAHFYPWDITHGFQHRVSAEDKRWLYVRDDYYHFLREHGHRKVHGNEHPGYHENRGAIVNKLPWELSVDRFVGQKACRFLRTYGGEQPFALMVGFPGPHCPYDPNQEWLDTVDAGKMPPAIPEVPGQTPKLREQNIEGNKRPWNGVDYTVFTDAHKRTIRAHYAALVQQIDYEVGQILDTLAEQGLLDNTVVIFASDHGDYLGDHNLIGKGTFYESSIHVPLMVRPPGGQAPSTYDRVVELTDVTATILALAGCTAPQAMDTIPLPQLGIDGERTRQWVFGMVANGWMIYDGRWKLCKYATGEQVLFDLAGDPHEQHNLIARPDVAGLRQQMDARLTQEIMRSLAASYGDRRVYTTDLSGDAEFGKRGWPRPYPRNPNGAP